MASLLINVIRYTMIKIDKINLLLLANSILFILSVSRIIYMIAIGQQQSNDFEFGCFVSYFHTIIINDGGLHSSNAVLLLVYLSLSCVFSIIMHKLKIGNTPILRCFMEWCCISLVTMFISISSFYILPQEPFVFVGFPLPFLFCSHHFCYLFELLEYRIISIVFIVIDIFLFYIYNLRFKRT